jgi:DNA-binding IclR family transcriptional regulator
MMKDGLVARDPASERYGLGPLIRRLAADVQLEVDLRGIAGPVLAELAADLQITAFLSVYQNGQAICLDRIHDMKGMEVRWWAIGGALPPNCGGAPKLLAFQPEEEIARVLAEPLVAMTPRSVLDPQTLKAHLRRVRKRGWDMAVDDVVVGLTALATAVSDPRGALVCAISIAGLTPQMAHRGKPVHLDRLCAAADRIAARLP